MLMRLTKPDQSDSCDSYIIVNNSPIGVGHSLLIPSLHGSMPQVLTPYSIRLAVEMMLISSCRYLNILSLLRSIQAHFLH